MEFLIELILEIVFDATVMDAALDGMESKKVPMPLRILLESMEGISKEKVGVGKER